MQEEEEEEDRGEDDDDSDDDSDGGLPSDGEIMDIVDEAEAEDEDISDGKIWQRLFDVLCSMVIRLITIIQSHLSLNIMSVYKTWRCIIIIRRHVPSWSNFIIVPLFALFSVFLYLILLDSSIT